MTQIPNVVGLKLCERGIVDLYSQNVTLVNCFRKFKASRYPAWFPKSNLCVVLTDGLGTWEMAVLMNRLETNEEAKLKSWTVRFNDPLKERWFLVPLPAMNIPAPGRYQIILLGNDSLISLSVLDFEVAGERK